MKKPVTAVLVIAFLLTCGLAFAGGKKAEEPEAPKSWWAEAAQPYKGATITGISESTPPSKFMQLELAPAFEKETGVKVRFEVTSWDEMYDKEIKDMEAGTGIYDFVYIEQDIVYAYLHRGFLVDLTAFMDENTQLVSKNLDLPDFTTFIDYFKDDQGHIYGLPFEAFLKTYLYRKDLFQDPDIKAAFRREYGRELQPATNFKEYEEIARFFTKWGKDHDMELWGSTCQAVTGHPASWYEVVETIWPSWGIYNWGINRDWKASYDKGGMMNSPKAKEAFRFWIRMLDYAPPESTSSTWDEVAATFAAGRAAQGWVYGENAVWIATDETRSRVVGNVGVGLVPTAPGVMDEVEAGEGYIGYYDGGAVGIPHSSKNKEAAFLFLQWVCRKDVQGEFAKAAGRIVRKSTFNDPIVREIDPKVDNYFTLMKEEGYLYGGAPPFPFHASLREVIAPYVWQAISGELDPDTALDKMARDADRELVRLGYGE
jgi:multiple sugar transport system substrate-binding protein